MQKMYEEVKASSWPRDNLKHKNFESFLYDVIDYLS